MSKRRSSSRSSGTGNLYESTGDDLTGYRGGFGFCGDLQRNPHPLLPGDNGLPGWAYLPIILGTHKGATKPSAQAPAGGDGMANFDVAAEQRSGEVVIRPPES